MVTTPSLTCDVPGRDLGTRSRSRRALHLWARIPRLLTLSDELSPRLNPSSAEKATERSASSGHSAKKSIVQLFTSEGKLRMRVRNASPIGERQSDMWMFVRTRLMKCEYSATLLSGRPAA